jgi:hypothetical protein
VLLLTAAGSIGRRWHGFGPGHGRIRCDVVTAVSSARVKRMVIKSLLSRFVSNATIQVTIHRESQKVIVLSKVLHFR